MNMATWHMSESSADAPKGVHSAFTNARFAIHVTVNVHSEPRLSIHVLPVLPCQTVLPSDAGGRSLAALLSVMNLRT